MTGGMHDRRDAGQEGCMTGGMHDRRDAKQEGCWKVEIHYHRAEFAHFRANSAHSSCICIG